jgi:hypothetical protein
MKIVSFFLFALGTIEIVWAFWGDFIDKNSNPSPTIASRFEAGILFWGLSFTAYVVTRKKGKRF